MSESFSSLLDKSLSTLDMQPGSIVSGVVLDVDKDWVTVHVGLKSEGVISLDEFRDNSGEVEINVGDEIEVLLRRLRMVMVKQEYLERKQEKFQHGKCLKKL